MRYLRTALAFILLLHASNTAASGMGMGGGSAGGGTKTSGGSGCSSGSGIFGSTGTSGGGFAEDKAPTDVVNRINPSQGCVQWMEPSQCYEELSFVTHYLPIAYITTPIKHDTEQNKNSSGDTSSGLGNTTGGGSGTSSGSGDGTSSATGALGDAAAKIFPYSRVTNHDNEMRQAWEAIVWEITDDDRDQALEDWDGCLCPYSSQGSGTGGGGGGQSSSSGSSSSGNPLASNSSSSCKSYDSSSTSSKSGGGGGNSSGSGSGSGSSGQGSSERRVFYNSSRDTGNWETGCRDTEAAQKDSLKQMMACAFDSMSFSTTSMQNSTSENCLGAWGALYPRYMYTKGSSELIGSAKIAYRAAHLAGNELNKMPPVYKAQAELQQADPKKSGCFSIGMTPLIVDLLSRVSNDGQYAWIYWMRIGCCMDTSGCSAGGSGSGSSGSSESSSSDSGSSAGGSSGSGCSN